MDHNSPKFKLQDGAVDSFTLLHRELQRWWHRLPVGLYPAYWPRILAVLTILGMLLAFHQVVRLAVQQGELQRKATAMHAEATWRCNTLNGLRASDSCLLQLNAAAHGDAMPQAQIIAAGAPID